jgi:hypothetical protein
VLDTYDLANTSGHEGLRYRGRLASRGSECASWGFV